jgi:RNA polymerase sigma factor (sigma-70 family)
MNSNGSSFPLSDTLFIIACLVARRNHVPRQDIQDCALSFVEHALKQEAERLDSPEPRSLTYWKQAAENWAKNYRRNTERQRHREIEWPRTEDEDGSTVSFDPSDRQPGPDGEICRHELRQWFEKAMEELKPEQKELFIRRILNGESLQVLAVETGRTPDAVRKIVYRACHHLRSYLERHGFDAGEASDYLAMMSPTPERKCCVYTHTILSKTEFRRKIVRFRKITRPVLPVSGVI